MYKLGTNIEIYKEQIGDNLTEYYVIVTNKREKEYIINEAIYNFMDNFTSTNSLDNVINTYVKLTNTQNDQTERITEQLTKFFNQLVNSQWIVDEDKLINEPVFEPYFELNHLLDGYKLTTIIANNSSTDVYLAKKPPKRKRYVIKVLNAKKFAHQENFEKYRGFFQNEYNFIKTFNSIYINKGIEYVDTLDYSYMVLEHINGKSVYRFIRHNALSAEQRSKIVLKMLKGFALIHSNKIYHGDIHLGNVLITPKLQVKVIDFGFSNYAVPNEDNLNKKPRNGGAHSFIPPERTLRSVRRKFNAVEQYQSEVYQIGLIIYYIFVKKMPFKARTWKTMVDEKKSFNIHEYEPFLSCRMPKAVREIIAKALENNPELRYKNAQELLKSWKKIVK